MFTKRSSTSFSEFTNTGYNANIARFIEYHKGQSEAMSTIQSEIEGIHKELPSSNLETFQHFQSHKNKTLANNIYPLPNEADLRSHRAVAVYTDRNLNRLPTELSATRLKFQMLDVSRNSIMDFPIEITQMPWLKSLKLDHNKIKSLPDQISNLVNLECLSLSYNKLENLPEGLCKLSKLNYLDLEGNFLKGFSKEITGLKSLETLNIVHNKLVEFPTDFTTLAHLCEFSFEWLRYAIPHLNTTQKGKEGIYIIKKLQNKCMELSMKSIRTMSFESFIGILSYQKIDISNRDFNKRTILHTATLYGDISVMDYLATKYPHLLDEQDQDGLSPLCLSIMSDKAPAIECLLKYKVDLLKGGGKHGSMLHIATKRLNLFAVKEALRLGEDPNRLDMGGNSALHYAINLMIEGNQEAYYIAKYLLDNGAKPNIKNIENWTPLHLAIRKKNPQVLDWIISHNFEVQEIDGHGEMFKLNKQGGTYAWTGLHIAAYSDNPEVIIALGEAKVNPFKRSLNGFTAKRIVKRFGVSLKLVEKYERDWLRDNVTKSKKKIIVEEASYMNLNGFQGAREIKNASKNIFRDLMGISPKNNNHGMNINYNDVGFGNVFKTRMGLFTPIVSSHKTLKTGGDSYDVIPESESIDDLDIETFDNDLQYIDYCSELNEDGQPLTNAFQQQDESIDKRQKLPDSARQQPKQFFKGKFELNMIQTLGINLENYKERLSNESNFGIDFIKEEISVLSAHILSERLLYSDKLKALIALRILQGTILDYIYRNYSVPFPRESFPLHIKDYLDSTTRDSKTQVIKNRMNQINSYYELIPQCLIGIFLDLEKRSPEAFHIKLKICRMIEELKYIEGIGFLQGVIESSDEAPLLVQEAMKCQLGLKSSMSNNVHRDQSKQAYHTFLRNQYAKVPSTKKHFAPLKLLEKIA